MRDARDASARLAEGERVGLSASKRSALEEKLAVAKAKAAEPWAERIDGAKAALRDVDGAVRAFVSEHLDELVTGLEADGRLAAEEVNAAAGALIAAQLKREQIASSISRLIMLVGRPGPGDVSRSVAEEAARAAAALAAAGGELPPTLDRGNEPWVRLLSSEPQAVTA